MTRGASRTRRPGVPWLYRSVADAAASSLIGMTVALALLLGATASLVLLIARHSSGDLEEAVRGQDEVATRTLRTVIASAGEPLDWEDRFPTPPLVLGVQAPSENGTGDLDKFRRLRDSVVTVAAPAVCPSAPCIAWSDVKDALGVGDQHARLAARSVPTDSLQLPVRSLAYFGKYAVDLDDRPDMGSPAAWVATEAGLMADMAGRFRNETEAWEWNWTVGVGNDALPRMADHLPLTHRDMAERAWMHAADVLAVSSTASLTQTGDEGYGGNETNYWKLVKFGGGIDPPSGAFAGARTGDFALAASYYNAGNDKWDSQEGQSTVAVIGPIDLAGTGSATLTFYHWIKAKSTPSGNKDSAGVVWGRPHGAEGEWTRLGSYTNQQGGAWNLATVDATPLMGHAIDIAFEWRHTLGTSGDIKGWFIDDVSVSVSRGQGLPSFVVYSTSFEPNASHYPLIVFGAGNDLSQLQDQPWALRPLRDLVKKGSHLIVLGQDTAPGAWVAQQWGLATATIGAGGLEAAATDHPWLVFPNTLTIDEPPYVHRGVSWQAKTPCTAPACHAATLFQSAMHHGTPAESVWAVATPAAGTGRVLVSSLDPAAMARDNAARAEALALLDNMLGGLFFETLAFEIGDPLPSDGRVAVGTARGSLTFRAGTGIPMNIPVDFTLYVWG